MRIRWRVVLFLWVAGILLPMACLALFSPISARIFGFLFGPLWVHVLMHALLFAVLGWLACEVLKRVGRVVSHVGLPAALLAVVVVALLQEGIQSSYKARPWGADEVLDVGVDIVAGTLGAMLTWLQRTPPR